MRESRSEKRGSREVRVSREWEVRRSEGYESRGREGKVRIGEVLEMKERK